ncbi:hypothetical protein ACRRTK_023313 [Alexandromys fortis]
MQSRQMGVSGKSMTRSSSISGDMCSLEKNDGSQSDTAVGTLGTSGKKRRSSIGAKMVAIVGLSRKSRSASQLSQTGAKLWRLLPGAGPLRDRFDQRDVCSPLGPSPWNLFHCQQFAMEMRPRFCVFVADSLTFFSCLPDFRHCQGMRASVEKELKINCSYGVDNWRVGLQDYAATVHSIKTPETASRKSELLLHAGQAPTLTLKSSG